ncbi:MAG TPA: peptidoglycan-binding protein [Herpetosiphonaceae bacterium]|nr:peptidoglycan-binding protein [Herpetosiphonaceae bacterium]
MQIHGLSWNPSTSRQLAAAMRPYECVGDGQSKLGSPGIYAWDPNEAGSVTPALVASGFYPVWSSNVFVEERMSIVRSRAVAAALALSLLAGCSMGGGAPQATVTPPPTAAIQGGLSPRPTATLPAQPTQAAAAPTTTPASQEGAAPAPTSGSPDPATPAPADPTAPIDTGGATGFSRDLQFSSPRMEGEDVRALQQRLIDLYYFQVDEADGIFGPNTRDGVIAFQETNNLPSEGRVDQATWDLLFSDQAVAFELVDPSLLGRIMYVKPDGVTLASVYPNGDDEQLLDQTQALGDQKIVALNADPTGTFIAYTANAFGSEEITLYILRADGTLLSTYGGMNLPNWSPDGARFVAESFSPDGTLAQVVMDTERQDEAGPVATLDGYSADWRADGAALVYVNNSNIFVYDLASQSSAQLTDLPGEGDEAWYVDEAHFSPDGSRIYFYAGQRQNVGASGNGMQWWIMPSAGGSAGCSQRFEGCGDPVAFTGPNGNGVGEFAWSPTGEVFAYSEGAHVSACSAVIQLWLRTTADEESPVTPNLGELPAEGGSSTLGFAWDPIGGLLAFGYQTYICDANFERALNPAEIYLWNPAAPGDPSRLAEGSYPAWIQ